MDFKTFKDLPSNIQEAKLVNHKDRGLEIIPSGGMGSWTEESLKSNLSKSVSEIQHKLNSKDYSGIEHLLYKGGTFKSKLSALARYDEYIQKNGKRPIAKDKEIDLGESEMRYQALAMAKDIHSSLAELTFIEMLSVMSPDNPAKKEIQEFETKINQLTTEVGEFIQKYIPDVADAETDDIDELPEEEEEDTPSANGKKKTKAKPKASKPKTAAKVSPNKEKILQKKDQEQERQDNERFQRDLAKDKKRTNEGTSFIEYKGLNMKFNEFLQNNQIDEDEYSDLSNALKELVKTYENTPIPNKRDLSKLGLTSEEKFHKELIAISDAAIKAALAVKNLKVKK